MSHRDDHTAITRRSLLVGSAGVGLAAFGAWRLLRSSESERRALAGYRLLTPGTKTIAAGTKPGYNAYPGFCKLDNGKRLVVASRAEGHLTGGGRAWKYVLEPDDTVSSSAELSTLIAPSTHHIDSGLLTCDDGRVVCVYAINRNSDVTSRVARIYSDDHGATWSAPALIPSGYRGPEGTDSAWSFVSSNPIQLPGGELRLALYGSDVDQGQIWYVRMVKSADRGETWSDMGVRILLPDRESAAEPNLVRLRGGRLFMAIRAGDLPGTGPQRILGCWSSDDGESWTTPRQILAEANARPSILETPERDVLITSRGPSDGKGPAQGFLALSANGGRSFPASGRQQLGAAKERFVYGSAIHDGSPDEDGALQVVAAQEVTGGANLYLYRLTRRTSPIVVSPTGYDEKILATDGLVSYWPLTDTSGQRARDLKGASHGELIGDVRLQRGSDLEVDGVVLDTADDVKNKFAYIKVPHAARLNMAGTMSLECWAAPKDVVAAALVVKGAPYNFRFELLGGRMVFGVNADEVVVGTARVDPGDAHMFAVTWDGREVRFFLDGEWDRPARRYTAAQTATDGDLWIGTATNGTAAPVFHGPVSSVALYDAKLDDDTIAEHYDAAKG